MVYGSEEGLVGRVVRSGFGVDVGTIGGISPVKERR